MLLSCCHQKKQGAGKTIKNDNEQCDPIYARGQLQFTGKLALQFKI